MTPVAEAIIKSISASPVPAAPPAVVAEYGPAPDVSVDGTVERDYRGLLTGALLRASNGKTFRLDVNRDNTMKITNFQLVPQ